MPVDDQDKEGLSEIAERLRRNCDELDSLPVSDEILTLLKTIQDEETDRFNPAKSAHVTADDEQ